MGNIFLQFYREEEFLYTNKQMINFGNGLSHVWDQIKNRGTLVWKEVDDETPITDRGTIYASVWYSKSIQTLYGWAKQFPDLKIFVCGPSVLHYDLKTGHELSNFSFIRGNAEDIFFNGKTSKWNLEVLETNKPIGYSVSFTDGIGCYWGKCNYCKITGGLKYREIDEVPIIENKNDKYIWLHTFSMPPLLIKKLYPKFEKRDDVYYGTYIRGDRYVTKVLKEVLPKMKASTDHLGFDVGIEFPTDRMLTYMNKGTTVREYLEFIKLVASYGSMLHFNLIVGWKYTNWDDVKNVELFLNELSKITKANTITVNIYPLTLVQDRKIMNDYSKEEIEPFETDFNAVFGMPKLTTEQQNIVDELLRLYHQYPFFKIYDFVNKKNTWSKRIFGGPGLSESK